VASVAKHPAYNTINDLFFVQNRTTLEPQSPNIRFQWRDVGLLTPGRPEKGRRMNDDRRRIIAEMLRVNPLLTPADVAKNPNWLGLPPTERDIVDAGLEHQPKQAATRCHTQDNGEHSSSDWLIAAAIIVGGLAIMLTYCPVETFLFSVVVLILGAAALNTWFETCTTNTRTRLNPDMICPHCQNKGVRTATVSREKGISGTKASSALLLGGVSVLVRGLSRMEQETECRCTKCGMLWHVE
jgi:hypothetical protein